MCDIRIVLATISRDLQAKRAAEREHAINEYIRLNASCNTNTKINAFQDGKIEQIEVYELPRTLLKLNPENGRFAAELDLIRDERQKKNLSLELDPDNPDDITTIRNMLKGIHPRNEDRANAYKKLFDNILEVASKTNRNGQEIAGLITYDGTYVNGNRRDTVMQDLSEPDPKAKRKGDPLKFSKIFVGRLKKGVTEYDLWKNEAKEQISQESREEYDYVNSALEIKRGYELLKKDSFSDKAAKSEIAKTLYGRDEKDVSAYLDFLKIADLFLKRIGKLGQYRYIQESGAQGEGGVVTILREVAKQRAKYAEEWDDDEISKWFNAVSLFCLLSKIKPTVTLPNGEKKKLSFGHREYRPFQKYAMDSPESRKKILDAPFMAKIDWNNPEKHALDYYVSVERAKDYTKTQLDLIDPLSLLEESLERLGKVNKELNGSQRSMMIKIIKENDGVKYIGEIKSFISQISNKVLGNKKK